MKLKVLSLLFLALFTICLGGCSSGVEVVESAPLSAEDLEALAGSVLLEIAIPSQNESLFRINGPSLELRREISRAGGSLVQDGRLLLNLFSFQYEFSSGQPALFAPFENWVKQHGVEKAHIWMDGGEMEVLDFYGDSDEPIEVWLIGRDLKMFDGT